MQPRSSTVLGATSAFKFQPSRLTGTSCPLASCHFPIPTCCCFSLTDSHLEPQPVEQNSYAVFRAHFAWRLKPKDSLHWSINYHVVDEELSALAVPYLLWWHSGRRLLVVCSCWWSLTPVQLHAACLGCRSGPSGKPGKWCFHPGISDACTALTGISKGLMERGKRCLIDML